MSREVFGHNAANDQLVKAVTDGAFNLVLEDEETTFIIDQIKQSARYAAQILLAALEYTGEIRPSSLTDDDFTVTIDNIVEATLDPANSKLGDDA